MAESMKECARNMTWDGCPAGKIECPQHKGSCAESLEECEEKTGCFGGNVSCGILRDSAGMPVLEVVHASSGETRIARDCRPRCKAQGERDWRPTAVTSMLQEEEYGGKKRKKMDATNEEGSVVLRVEMKGEAPHRHHTSATCKDRALPTTDSITETLNPNP
jgi:hypothetical protein